MKAGNFVCSTILSTSPQQRFSVTNEIGHSYLQENGSLYQSWTVWQFWGLMAITIVNLKFEGHKWKRTKVAVNQRWGVIICKALSAPVTWPFWSCWTWWIEARSRAQKPRKMVFKWVLFICVNRTSTALPNATHNFDNFLLIPCVVKA